MILADKISRLNAVLCDECELLPRTLYTVVCRRTDIRVKGLDASKIPFGWYEVCKDCLLKIKAMTNLEIKTIFKENTRAYLRREEFKLVKKMAYLNSLIKSQRKEFGVEV